MHTTIALQQSNFTDRDHVKSAPELPDGPSQYERLGTIHDIDPLENIERELREIDETIAGLKEESEQHGHAQKYAKTMLRQLTISRADSSPSRRCGYSQVGNELQ
jgi:hypothetical protein